jgi:hypothetical protein
MPFLGLVPDLEKSPQIDPQGNTLPHLLDTPLEPGPLAGLIVLDAHLLVVVDQPPLPPLLSTPAVLQTLLRPEIEFTKVL